MPERCVSCTYFDQTGPENTERTLELAAARAEQLGTRYIVVASTTGETGLKAAQRLSAPGREVVVVTHSTGFAAPNTQELTVENRTAIENAGVRILTGQHALGGLNRAIRRKLGTYELDEIVAFVLRNFSQGVKVACEITLMATDAGLVPAGEDVIAIGGTGRGADTAVLILAANSQDFFDLRVLELLCMPSRLSIPG
ncbi:MAG: pyruvate kinase alpha/beta domain-containing protein [Anaerolineae bacterium]